MPNVLLIHDSKYAADTTVMQILSSQGIPAVSLDLIEFHPEYLLSEIFDLIIFELFGESWSCMLALYQLECWSATSGIEHPPVIVVADENSGSIEQAVRTAKVNFYFIKPVVEAELISAIKHALLPYKQN
ncbi:MAG: hypothetical protein P4L42_06195 [Desulfocapsaceae bacterium]|nr:hypothetical protein [Desulfocapsaceae bacterium]